MVLGTHSHLNACLDVQVEAAKDFLLRANPVNKKNIAPVRKSSFQHALCDMLYSILGPNVASDLPRWGLMPGICAASTHFHKADATQCALVRCEGWRCVACVQASARAQAGSLLLPVPGWYRCKAVAGSGCERQIIAVASSHLPAVSEPRHVLHRIASPDCMQDADMKLCHVPASGC